MSRLAPPPLDSKSLIAAQVRGHNDELLTAQRALRHAVRTLDLLHEVGRSRRDLDLGAAIGSLIAELNLSREERAALHESLTSDPETNLHALSRHHVESASRAVANVTDDFERPLMLVVHGARLSEAEYRVAGALGVRFATPKDFGLSEVDEYELFDNLFYEDDSWLGYLNLTPEPPDDSWTDEAGVTHMTMRHSVGRHPEECLLAALRPEQIAFFESFMPDVVGRFRRS